MNLKSKSLRICVMLLIALAIMCAILFISIGNTTLNNVTYAADYSRDVGSFVKGEDNSITATFTVTDSDLDMRGWMLCLLNDEPSVDSNSKLIDSNNLHPYLLDNCKHYFFVEEEQATGDITVTWSQNSVDQKYNWSANNLIDEGAIGHRLCDLILAQDWHLVLAPRHFNSSWYGSDIGAGKDGYWENADFYVGKASSVFSEGIVSASATGCEVSYDGEAHGIEVSVTNPSSGYTIQYGTQSGNYDSEEITYIDAGTYTIYYRVIAPNMIGATGSAVVVINKVDAAVDLAPTPKELEYTGGEQVLVNEGSASGGTMQYKLEGGEYSEELPLAKKAGTHTIYYKVVGDKNHNDTLENSISTVIQPNLGNLISEATNYYDSIKDVYQDVASALNTAIESAQDVYEETEDVDQLAEAFNALLDAMGDANVGVVEAKIDAIGTILYTDETKALISEARSAYTALDDELKSSVSNFSTLTYAESTYRGVDIVVIQTNETILESSDTQTFRNAVNAVRVAYDNLSEYQKSIYPDASLKVLVDDEKAIEVMDAINEVGAIRKTSECIALLDTALTKYNALDEDQKTLVKNIDKLPEEGYIDFKVLFWSDKKDVALSANVWKLAIVEELKYIHEMFPVVKVTVVEKNDDFTLDIKDLIDVDMIVIAFYGFDKYNLSSDIDTQANADILKVFLDNGGRIMMFGERNVESNEGNAILGGLAQKMGGGFEMATENYGGLDFTINPNYADTLAKDIAFVTGTTDYVNLYPHYMPSIIGGETTDYIFKGGDNCDFVVNQAIGIGNITVISDTNLLFNGGYWEGNIDWYSENGFEGGNHDFNKMMVRFFYNSLIDSSSNLAEHETIYDLWVGDVHATSLKNAGDGWIYDASTNTLTLENYTYNKEGSRAFAYDVLGCIYYGGDETLKLVVLGENNITITGTLIGERIIGIFVEYARLEISGNGTLNIQLTYESQDESELPYSSSGIFCYYDITINDANITIKTTKSRNSEGIYADGDLIVNNASLDITVADSMTSFNAGIYVENYIIVNNSTIISRAGNTKDVSDYGSMSAGIIGSLVLNSGRVEAYGKESEISCGIYLRSDDDLRLEINGGTLIAKASDIVHDASDGVIYYAYAVDMPIGANVEYVEISGGSYAAYTSALNEVLGYGWLDVEGTQGGQVIPLNAGDSIEDYKKIIFPYVEPTPEPGPTPGPTPGPEPEPTPTPEPTPSSKRVDENTGVSIETSDGTEIPQDIVLKVVLKADVATIEGKVDPAKIQAMLLKNEAVYKVYDIKLIKTEGGIEKEVQPSDIKDGMKIKVQIELPKDVKLKGLRILHIHNDGSIDNINNVALNGRKAIIEVASLSEFVIIHNASHGFCVGWVVFIFAMLELLGTGLYLLIRFHLLDNLMAKLKIDNVDIKKLVLICLCVSLALFIFALIALCFHVCAISIVSLVLTILMLGAFIYFVVKDRNINQDNVKEIKEDKIEAQDVEQ